MIHNFKTFTSRFSNTASKPTHLRGFTLVELLVTISIFLVLITLTATLIRRTTDSEKIRTAASQLQAYIEGARARAFQQKKPVGIRFILDKDDPSTASSMVYLETSTEETGQLHFFPAGYLTTPSGTLTSAQIYTPTTGFLATNSGPANNIASDIIGQLSDTNSIKWSKLKEVGLLVPGVQLEINGIRKRHVVQASTFFTNVDKTPVSILEIKPGSLLDVNSNYGPYTYTLFPAAVPMKNVTPTELPRGTTIDFQSSKLPGNWGSINWTAGYVASSSDKGKYIIPKTGNNQKRLFRIAQEGKASNTEPNWDSFALGTTITDWSGNLLDSPIKYDILTSAQLDIMFSPSGAVDGAISAEGVLRFVLAKKEDTDADLRVENLLNADNQPRGDQIIVSLYTLSGALSISQIDPTDEVENANPTNMTPDNKADNPFSLAEAGEESK